MRTITINMTDENYKHVSGIAKELENIIDNEYKYIDGEAVEVLEDENGFRYLEHDGVFYAEKGHEKYFDENTEDIDTLDNYDIWNYFDDVLDINYIINADRTYNAVRLLVAFGGPNIYIDTFKGVVSLYWWTEYAECDLRPDVVEAIDTVFDEYYNMC